MAGTQWPLSDEPDDYTGIRNSRDTIIQLQISLVLGVAAFVGFCVGFLFIPACHPTRAMLILPITVSKTPLGWALCCP